MYESYWGLSASPFGSRLDPRWFHQSPVHEEALARLFYVIEQRRAFGLLMGSSGTGKTFLLKVLANQVRRTRRQIACIDLLGMDAPEMLWQTATALRLSPTTSASRWNMWRGISDQLESLRLAHSHLVFVFDHLDRADATCHTVLQRLFAACGTSGNVTFLASVRSTETSLLSSLLSELSDLRVELTPLELSETEAHISDLMQRAGGNPEAFSKEAVVRIHSLSSGLPRQVNRLCELCLIAAMGEELDQVDADLVDGVAEGLVTQFDPLDSILLQPQFA